MHTADALAAAAYSIKKYVKIQIHPAKGNQHE